jgi:lipoprotein-anchoring transpeptidase ErfK/SrfK
MLRWIVRALLVVTLVVVVMLAVGGRHQGVASADRLVVDQAAQASPSVSKVAPAHRVTRAVSAHSTQAAAGTVKTKADGSAAACAAVTVPHEIVVDIRRQELWACHGPQLAFSTKVTTGAVYLDEATPDGTWQIYAKQTHRWLSGPGYDVEVNYWMPFFGGYGIHDAPWQKMPYGTDDYLARGSHGCVQVPGAVMARLYAWAPVGATVHVED